MRSWPGLISSVEHLRHQLFHAVGGIDLGEAFVGLRQRIVHRKHADAHVEPLVAVDDVIAGHAHDGVAAVAAEDDVAGAVRRDARAEDGLQAGDAGDARRIECAAGKAFRAALGEWKTLFGEDVGAGQNVVEARTG